jgi:RNA polymerase sigma factor (sigma-70 family)
MGRLIALLSQQEPSQERILAAQDPQTLVAELAASHGPQLRRFLLARVRNAADVPDIVQDVYLRMLRIPHVESIRSPEAYLFTVAQHVLQQYTLRQSQIPPSIDLAGMLEPPHARPDADPVLEMNAQQCLEDLQQALDSFTPKIRATFMLHRRDGLSFDEIGTQLGISRPMVKKNLINALMQFRRKLEKTE